ncbi:Ig-like domain-containing protein [Gorillibacterium sp. sgz5001074]|uniref:S-layer homology domain-containing protein n=1 Tax=Gorillibacterium sp. sgz5001074 TaxID=3446695 RepID=UPI003F67FCB5
MKQNLPKWLVATMVLTAAVTPHGTAAKAGGALADPANTVVRFSDIEGLDPAYQSAIRQAVELGWINGDTDGRFRPADSLSRQELAKLLTTALHLPKEPNESNFRDVSPESWSAPYIEAVRKAGLMTGDTGNTFRPLDPVNREELAAILIRASKDRPPAEPNRLLVADRAEISGWAGGYVEQALVRGLFDAPDLFHPLLPVERKDVAEVLLRAYAAGYSPDLELQAVTAGHVRINGISYTVAKPLQGIFAESNRDILKGARIRFEARDGQLLAVKELTITAGGKAPAEGEPEFSRNLMLDGQGTVLDGSLRIAGDYTSVKRLDVLGDLEITKRVENDFWMDDVTVAGKTVVNGGDSHTVVFSNSQLGQVEVNKENVRVESLGTTSVDAMLISSSSMIVGSADATIGQVTLKDGAKQVDLSAAVGTLVIAGTDPTVLTGTGNIGVLKLDSTAPVTLNNQGTVGTLTVVSPSASLTVGTSAKIDNLTLPAGVSASNVIPNYSSTQTQISQINGVSTAPLNSSPVQVAAIPNQTIQLTGGPVTIDISGVFLDPDGDTLTITPNSRTRTVATVKLEGKQLIITPVAAGSSVIQLSASDGSLSGASRFTVYVNTAPTVKPNIDQTVVTLGADPVSVNLAAFFSDADPDVLTYTAVASDPGLAGASISGGSLLLSPVKEGTLTVSVTASDGRGGSVTGTLPVLVNRPPELQNPLHDTVGTIGRPDEIVELMNVFSDPDGDALTYEAASQNTALADTSVLGSRLSLVPKSAGMSVITVKAKDGKGGVRETSFRFTINRAPAVASVPDQLVTLGTGPLTLDLQNSFRDEDHDLLTFRAEVQDPSVAAASLAGSVLTLTPAGAGSTAITVTALDGRGGEASTGFRMTVNRAPESSTAFGQQTVTIGGDPVVLTLTDFFRDLDGDGLSFEWSTPDTQLLQAAAEGARLTFTGISPGTAGMTVKAKDGRGGEAAASLSVLVNRAPETSAVLADRMVTVGDAPVRIPTDGLFTDADQDTLVLDAVIGNPALADLARSGNEFILTPRTGGTATITITATDGKGGKAAIPFTLTVNEPPRMKAVPDQTIQLNGPERNVELMDYFKDPDGDPIVFTLGPNAADIASATLTGTSLVLQPVGAGTVQLTLLVEDGRGGAYTGTLRVTVNRSPEATGTLADHTVTIGAVDSPMDLTGLFRDPDGDPVTIEAKIPDGNDGSRGLAVMEGNLLKLTGLAPGLTAVELTAHDGRGGSASLSFALSVNRAPAADQALADQGITLGQGDLSVDVSQAFVDADGDAITLGAVSLDPGLASVSLNGTMLTVHPVAGGSAGIRVTAEDGRGGKGEQQFKVRINRNPSSGTLADLTVVLEKGEQDLNILSLFRDDDGDSLTFTAVSSDPTIAAAAVNGQQLKAVPAATGSVNVTVTAADGYGGSLERTFRLTVELNQAPQAAVAIPDQTVTVGGTQAVELSGAFADANHDGLTYTAVSASEGVAAVSISGHTLTLTGITDGTSVITVTASDGIAASAGMTFTVTASSNQAPTVAGSIPLQVIGGSVAPNRFSLSGLFADADGDSLTYSVTAADSGKVAATIQGDQLTLAPGSAAGGSTVTVTAADGRGGSVSADISVLTAQVVHSRQIVTKLGVSDVSYDLSAYFPAQSAFTVYRQEQGAMTQDGVQAMNGKIFRVFPGSLGTSRYWVVAADHTAAYVEVTVEAQQGAGAFFSEYTRGSDGRIALEIYNKSENSTDYQVVGYRYNTKTSQLEVMKNRDIPQKSYAVVGLVYPGTTGIVINYTFYDLMDITPVQYYQDELEMTADGNDGYVICAFELVKGGQVVDVIGDKAWTPSSGNPYPLPVSGTLIRKPGIAKGSLTYHPNGEWEIRPAGYQDLSRHTP